MKITQFIEKAIEGGWENTRFGDMRFMERVENVGIFLDPLAWQAVGKVEGWWDRAFVCSKVVCRDCHSHIEKMHRMIDALAEGKSIEEFLATL